MRPSRLSAVMGLLLLCSVPLAPAAAAKRKRATPATAGDKANANAKARAIPKESAKVVDVTGVSSARTRPTLSPKRSESGGATVTTEGALGTPDATGDVSGSASANTKSAKTKVYTFGAMDVEGKLKTPQLLYFLNRVKLELEMSAPDHRSFMKDLEKTAEDPNL